jgi:hypothetical protein
MDLNYEGGFSTDTSQPAIIRPALQGVIDIEINGEVVASIPADEAEKYADALRELAQRWRDPPPR